jgi:hypothetical protein
MQCCGSEYIFFGFGSNIFFTELTKCSVNNLVNTGQVEIPHELVSLLTHTELTECSVNNLVNTRQVEVPHELSLLAHSKHLPGRQRVQDLRNLQTN